MASNNKSRLCPITEEGPLSPSEIPTPFHSRASTPTTTSSAASTVKAAGTLHSIKTHTAGWIFGSATHQQLSKLHNLKPTWPQLTASALQAHDKRVERHSIRQAIRHGQHHAPKPTKPKQPRQPEQAKVIPRLEGQFRDAAAETIYGLESALSTLAEQHCHLESVNASLQAQIAELQARNHVLVQTASRERSARMHAESKANVQKNAMQAEVDYLRRTLAAAGKEDLRSHRTVATKQEPAQRAPRTLLPPWHPGADDGVDHDDMYGDVLGGFLAHGTLPHGTLTHGTFSHATVLSAYFAATDPLQNP